MTLATINAASTMQEVLDACPSAQRALFQRFHIGGCNTCLYEPGDILGAVVRSDTIEDLDELIAFNEQAGQNDRRIQMNADPHFNGVTDVDIEIVWEPPWDASRMSEAAQLQLGML